MGESEAEALAEMKLAIRHHLELLKERGESIPDSATVNAVVIDIGSSDL